MKQKKNHQSGKASNVSVKNIQPEKKEQERKQKTNVSEIRFFENPNRRRYSIDDNGGGYMGL